MVKKINEICLYASALLNELYRHERLLINERFKNEDKSFGYRDAKESIRTKKARVAELKKIGCEKVYGNVFLSGADIYYEADD